MLVGGYDGPTSTVGNSGYAKSPTCYAGAMPKPVKTKTPRPTKEQAAERYEFLDKAVRQTDMQLDELESALGMYVIGWHFGWKVLYVIHSKKTIRKYEEILGIKIRDVFKEVGDDAHRTNAFKLIEAVSSFWKYLSGDEKPGIDVDKRAV